MEIRNFFNVFFGNIRVIEDEETREIWFVGNEVAAALGYQNLAAAILRHTSEEDRKVLYLKSCKNLPEAVLWENAADFRPKTLINESGVYCMIFGSNMDSAKEFKRWVTKVILPSIREYGGYIEGQEDLELDEQAAIHAEIESLQEKIAYLQKRRHVLRAQLLKQQEDKRKLKAQKKSLVRSNDAYKKAYDEQLDLYIKILGECAAFEEAAYKARKAEQATTEEPKHQERHEEERKTIKVNAYGFIIS